MFCLQYSSLFSVFHPSLWLYFLPDPCHWIKNEVSNFFVSICRSCSNVSCLFPGVTVYIAFEEQPSVASVASMTPMIITGLAPSLIFWMPYLVTVHAQTVAVLGPSTPSSFMLLVTSWTNLVFLYLSFKSIAFAIIPPSFVTLGLPQIIVIYLSPIVMTMALDKMCVWLPGH